MLVFVHINKTAGSTVRYMLRSSFGTQHCDVEPWHAPYSDPPFSTDDLRRLRRLYPRLASIAGHRVTGYEDLHEDGTTFEYFTFVRDPVKATASRFQYNVNYRKKKGLVFEDWIQNDWVRNYQTKRLAGTADLDAAIEIVRQKRIFVGLRERFDESMLLLKALRARDLDISYRKVNVASDNSLAAQLIADAATRRMLEEANDVDIKLYEFARKDLYPGYQKEYGPRLDEDLKEYQRDSGDFNHRRIFLSRVKRFGLYKPALYLYRKPVTRHVLARLVD